MFLEDKYIDLVLSRVSELEGATYYSRMGLAWLISVIMMKFPEKGLLLLSENNLDDWTVNKAIQKTKESFRTTPEVKSAVNRLKRKNLIKFVN